MRILDVSVKIEVDTTGKITPLEIKDAYFDDWFEVSAPKYEGMKYNMEAGVKGHRYTCIIEYYGVSREIYLFNEGMKWFTLSAD
jgi:hypothetical protein